MKHNIEAVIFDWAGTTIDYGSFAPLFPFIQAFANYGLKISAAEARGPMGKLKIDHIADLLNLESVKAQFNEKYQRGAALKDINAIYHDFEQLIFAGLSNYALPIDHVLSTVAKLREMKLKIGSTTGYTAKMMEIVAPLAQQNGYAPDCWVSSDQVNKGRPYPYMIFQNMHNLKITSSSNVLKIGDTLSDIIEGKNAGVISVGVVLGSSELGLSQLEYTELSTKAQQEKVLSVKYKMFAAGADFVINSMDELPLLIESINAKRK